MTWARLSSVAIAVAVALILVANTPAVLTDPIETAIAQIRVNAAKTTRADLPLPASEMTSEEEMSVQKKASSK